MKEWKESVTRLNGMASGSAPQFPSHSSLALSLRIYFVKFVCAVCTSVQCVSSHSIPSPVTVKRVSILNIRWQWVVHMLIYWTCWNVINEKIITRDIFLDMWRNQRWFTACSQCICYAHTHKVPSSYVDIHRMFFVSAFVAFLTCVNSP